MELAGVYEISEKLEVGRTTVSMWAGRRDVNGFPEPLAVLRSGPVYHLDDVVSWFHQRYPDGFEAGYDRQYNRKPGQKAAAK